jgi:hypothetical protein
VRKLQAHVLSAWVATTGDGFVISSPFLERVMHENGLTSTASASASGARPALPADASPSAVAAAFAATLAAGAAPPPASMLRQPPPTHEWDAGAAPSAASAAPSANPSVASTAASAPTLSQFLNRSGATPPSVIVTLDHASSAAADMAVSGTNTKRIRQDFSAPKSWEDAQALNARVKELVQDLPELLALCG